MDYTLVKYDDIKDLTSNDHGFWVLPNGDVLCLEHAMTHGEVAAAHEPLIWQRIDKELDEGKTGTTCDFAACDLGWFRINLTQFNGDLNCGWQKSPAVKQLVALRFVLDACDCDAEANYWWETGTGTQEDMVKAYKSQVDG